MYDWETTASLHLPNDHADKDSPFGDPLWHTLPVDSTSEDPTLNPFLYSKEESEPTKDETYHMNGLKEIWDESSRKSVQSVCFENDDRITSSSLNESRISLQKTDMECSGSLIKQRNSEVATLLMNVIPVVELAERNRNEVTSCLVNEKKGFININKLADMIVSSLKSQSLPL